PADWPPARSIAGFGVAIVLGVAAIAFLQWPRDVGSGEATVDQVRERDPRFYAFYVSQPVVEALVPAKAPDGQPAPAITVVEFTDFECPYCARAYQDLKRALGDGAPDVA